MHKSRTSRSDFANSRLLLAVFLLCTGGALLTLVGIAAPSSVDVTGKIAPWVLEHSAYGGQAEFLVVLSDQANLSHVTALRTKTEKGRYVRDTLWKKAQATQAPVLQWLRANHIEHRSYYIVNMIWIRASIEVAQVLAARPDVAWIEGNPEIHNVVPEPDTAAATPDQPQQVAAIEAGINYTHAPQVWALGYTGQGIVVAGADTGYRWDHNALKAHYRGWNGASADHNYNWHDSVHSNAGANPCGFNSPVPCDDLGHGTHTMGTAVGDDGAGNQIGMAPGAKWIGCRNMDAGNGTPARYIECMEFFLAPYPLNGTTAQGDPNRAPDISTNSWDCPASEGCSVNDLKMAAEAQRAAGIMMVVAAGNGGNSGRNDCSTVNEQPGTLEAVYSIGALNTGTDTLASFSSKGPVTLDGSNRLKPDLCAPGTNTRSAYNTSTTAYANLSGTSMAAPHVAGAVALLWSAQPSLRNDVDATENILNQRAVHVSPPSGSLCDPIGTTSPNNVFGYGRLNIEAAVDLDNVPPVTTITAPVAKEYLHSDFFVINYSVTDGNGSGVKSAIPNIDGKTTLYDGTTAVTVANGLAVKLLTELRLGIHTFNVDSVDNLGNADTATITFSIIVTAQSIKDEVNYFRSIGAITQDKATSLLQKLNAAAAYRTKGNCKNMHVLYKNFINELRAQMGKKVTPQAAAILIADAQYLIVHCP